MPEDPRKTAAAAPATPRRAFLRTLALAPALAGCASSRGAAPSAASPSGAAAARRPPPDERQGGPDPAPPGAGDEDPLAPIRAFPLGADAEPAFVFRAVAARTGE